MDKLINALNKRIEEIKANIEDYTLVSKHINYYVAYLKIVLEESMEKNEGILVNHLKAFSSFEKEIQKKIDKAFEVQDTNLAFAALGKISHVVYMLRNISLEKERKQDDEQKSEKLSVTHRRFNHLTGMTIEIGHSYLSRENIKFLHAIKKSHGSDIESTLAILDHLGLHDMNEAVDKIRLGS